MSVIVATFGDPFWQEMAAKAAASVPEQNVILVHSDTLHDARNDGATIATSEWLCFLDADDTLEPAYFDHMAAATGDLRVPSVRYVRKPSHNPPPVMPNVAGHTHACDAGCLAHGNWLVIGTLIRRDLFMQVGGFRDFPCYEDWDLWLRCWLAGATVEAVPAAVYRAQVRHDSRNRGQLSPAQKHAVHQQIARSNRVPVPA